MKLYIFRAVTAVLLILWMCCIFSLSAQDAGTSSKTSAGVIKTVVSKVYPNFDTLDSAEQDEIVGSYQFIARKTAHFTAYAFLGLLSFLCIISYFGLPFLVRPAISAGICLAYAAGDEIHQRFVPGRSGELRDVLIDFSGALLAIIICTVLTRCIKKLHRMAVPELS